MDRVLIDYLPPVIQAMREMKAITDGQQDGISTLWDCVDAALNDQFVDTATENGINRWEKILAITPKGTETLDSRRFRVKARLNEQLPFTIPVLNQQLETLCGEDGYSVVMERGTYILYVKVSLVAKSNLDDVGDLLRRIVPAEIVIDLTLKYNTHEILSRFTHTQLSAYTHEQLRSEVLPDA